MRGTNLLASEYPFIAFEPLRLLHLLLPSSPSCSRYTTLSLEASASSYVVIQGDFLFLPSLQHSCHCGLPALIHTFEREMFEFADLRIIVELTPYSAQPVKLYE